MVCAAKRTPELASFGGADKREILRNPGMSEGLWSTVSPRGASDPINLPPRRRPLPPSHHASHPQILHTRTRQTACLTVCLFAIFPAFHCFIEEDFSDEIQRQHALLSSG